MPLAKSWAEELVAEYLILRGYLVITDVGVGSGRGGGRVDVDVVAIDPSEKEIRIVDVKCIWIGKPKKISQEAYERLRRAESILKKRYGDGYRYVKELILISYKRPKVGKIAQMLKGRDIEVKSILDLIHETVKYIDEWREEQRRIGLVKQNTSPTLPDQLYIVKLLEFLRDTKIIKIQDNL